MSTTCHVPRTSSVRVVLLLAGVAMLVAYPTANVVADEAEIVDVRKIWDAAPHNAFTDLIRYQDRWYCTFREGQGTFRLTVLARYWSPTTVKPGSRPRG